MNTTVNTTTYTRSHAAKYMASGMQNILRDLIANYGLDPTALMTSWPTFGRAIEAWLISGDLNNIVVEFYTLNATQVSARWDFPISYDGIGEDDMWLNRTRMSQIAQKSVRPPAGALYRVVMITKLGAPDVEGMGDTSLRSTGTLISRSAGSAIATPSMMAGMCYWGN